jgi:hypothetical protein
MRIEQQGHAEAQAFYAHVGYISAALAGDPRYVRQTTPFPAALLGAAVLAMMVGLVVVRRARSVWWRGVAGLFLVTALGSGAYALHLSQQPPPPFPDEIAAVTLNHIEKLSAIADGWVAAHGRPPTPEEWARLATGPDALNGFGRPLRYALVDAEHPGPRTLGSPTVPLAPSDGYVIYDEASRDGMAGPDYRDLSDWSLGQDRIYGTDDDSVELKYLLTHVPLDKMWYPHGRMPRTGGGTHADRAAGAR